MAHIETDKAAEMHRALGDPMRIQIMRLLLERELCVCEIMDALDAPQYKVSRHLGSLKRAGWVRGWREGTWMHYEIDPNLAPEWREGLNAFGRVWEQCVDVQAALWRLQQRAQRPAGGPAVNGRCREK